MQPKNEIKPVLLAFLSENRVRFISCIPVTFLKEKKLVRSLTTLFNIAISEMKGHGWRAIPIPSEGRLGEERGGIGMDTLSSPSIFPKSAPMYERQCRIGLCSSGIKQALKTSVSGINTSSQMITPFTGMRFINDCLPDCRSPRYTSIIHFFNSPTSRILFWSLMHCFLCRFYSHRFHTWAVKVVSYLASKLRSRMQYAIEIGSNCDFPVSRGSALATQLRWSGRPCNSYIDSFRRNLTVKEFWKSVYIWSKVAFVFLDTVFRSEVAVIFHHHH